MPPTATPASQSSGLSKQKLHSTQGKQAPVDEEAGEDDDSRAVQAPVDMMRRGAATPSTALSAIAASSSASGGKRGGSRRSGSRSSAKFRVPKALPPLLIPAQPIVKGSRVEVAYEEKGVRRWLEASVLQVGGKDREGRLKLQYSNPDGTPAGGGLKEWRSLDEVRPAPPEPPEAWTLRTRPLDAVEAWHEGSWLCGVAFEEVLLSSTEPGEQQCFVRVERLALTLTLPSRHLRPLWQLQDGQWSLVSRKVGARGAVCLTLRSDDKDNWEVASTLSLTPSQLLSLTNGMQPPELAHTVSAASADPQSFSVFLRQEDGEWCFAGDGHESFSSPLAPLPEESHLAHFSVGDEVEVGPEDEGYLGSWYAATITATMGGPEPDMVQVRYSALEETDGEPLVEWQPKSLIRPTPPALLEGSFSPEKLQLGRPMQMLYNDGWWECIVSPAAQPDSKDARRRPTERREEKAARKKQPPPASAVLGSKRSGLMSSERSAQSTADEQPLNVKFVHYDELHENIDPACVRPAWVWRGGEWLWRVEGGALVPLTTRMADGKVSKEGLVRPLPKRAFVPGGLLLSLSYSRGEWRVSPEETPAPDEEESTAEWIATLTVLRTDAATGFRPHSAVFKRLGVPVEEDPTPQQLFHIGQCVEVMQEDEGYEGSFYTADLLAMEGERAQVMYHAFDEDESSNVKLKDWVQVRRIRPQPPSPPPDFVSSLSSGQLLEMLHEDGWWQAKLSRIRPPEGRPAQRGSADEESNAHQYVVETVPYGQEYVSTAPELRPCSVWLWRSNRWERTSSLATLETHRQMLVDDEALRFSSVAKREKKRALLEARKQAKQDELEAKRAQRDEEKDAKRRSKLAEEAEKREKRRLEVDERKRQREQEMLERRQQRQAAAEAAKLERLVAAAAKKGVHLGAAMEAPLLGGGEHGEYAGSWYAGRVAELLDGGNVLFEYDAAVSDLPSAARDAQSDAGTAVRAMVSLEDLRPPAPVTPEGFSALVDVGQDLEVLRDGGWWRVSLVEVLPRAADDDESHAATSAGSRASAFRVQLAERNEDDEARFVVPLLELRPGWQWSASGKWIGKWVPKSRRQEEREAAFVRLQQRWPVGYSVEVLQSEAGMQGSWYSGDVVGHEFPDKCVVRYHHLQEDDADYGGDLPGSASVPAEASSPAAESREDAKPTPFEAPEPLGSLRPIPPDSKEDWHLRLALGDAVDLRFEDGWWEVELTEILRPDPTQIQYVVKSVHFDAAHTVDVERLRPPFVWEKNGDSESWKLREPPKVHMLDGKPRVEEVNARGTKRRKQEEKDPRRLGQPKDKASSFGNGTKRRGVDGRMWQVAMLENLSEVWVPVDKDDRVDTVWLGDVGQGNPQDKKKDRSKVRGKSTPEEDESKEDTEPADAPAEEPEEEVELGEISLAPVLEHELRLAGVTAKKGYEDLVYEAIVALLGEAMVSSHTAGHSGSADARLWCLATCPGCQRDLKMLVVWGLDVVQCCYCAHWSFTCPPYLQDAVALAKERNDPLVYAPEVAAVKPQRISAHGVVSSGAEAGVPPTCASSHESAMQPLLAPPVANTSAPLIGDHTRGNGTDELDLWHLPPSAPPSPPQQDEPRSSPSFVPSMSSAPSSFAVRAAEGAGYMPSMRSMPAAFALDPLGFAASMPAASTLPAAPSTIVIASDGAPSQPRFAASIQALPVSSCASGCSAGPGTTCASSAIPLPASAFAATSRDSESAQACLRSMTTMASGFASTRECPSAHPGVLSSLPTVAATFPSRAPDGAPASSGFFHSLPTVVSSAAAAAGDGPRTSSHAVPSMPTMAHQVQAARNGMSAQTNFVQSVPMLATPLGSGSREVASVQSHLAPAAPSMPSSFPLHPMDGAPAAPLDVAQHQAVPAPARFALAQSMPVQVPVPLWQSQRSSACAVHPAGQRGPVQAQPVGELPRYSQLAAQQTTPFFGHPFSGIGDSGGGLFLSHWTESGLRGVFRCREPGRTDRWQAVLPTRRLDGLGYEQRFLGEFESPRAAAEAFGAAARALPPAQQGVPPVRFEVDPMREAIDASRAGAGLDIVRLFRIAVLEDLEDGGREPVELWKSERSESGYKGVHRSGTSKAGQERWQTQVYYDNQLYHVGYSDQVLDCARIFAVCMLLITKLSQRGLLIKGSAFKTTSKRQKREKALETARPARTVSLAEFAQEDTSDIQLHVNSRAASKCQGVYLNPHINLWGVVAPGKAHLGYFASPKQAAKRFSQYVAQTATALGRSYTKNPWPPSSLDCRKFWRIPLASCPLQSGPRLVDQQHGASAGPTLDVCEAASPAVVVAECVHELVDQVERLIKQEQAEQRRKAQVKITPAQPAVLLASEVVEKKPNEESAQERILVAEASFRAAAKASSDGRLGATGLVNNVATPRTEAAKYSHLADSSLLLAAGQQVEFRQQSTGDVCAWSLGAMVEVDKDSLMIQIRHTSPGASSALTWVPLQDVRPLPPALPEQAALDTVEIGDALEVMRPAGSWWPATVTDLSAGPSVTLVGLDEEQQRVPAQRVRAPFSWRLKALPSTLANTSNAAGARADPFAVGQSIEGLWERLRGHDAAAESVRRDAGWIYTRMGSDPAASLRQGEFFVGQPVEVRQISERRFGSLCPATVLEVDAEIRCVRVRYHRGDVPDLALRDEWVALALLQPQPPVASSDWPSSLRGRVPVQVLREGSIWSGELVGLLDARGRLPPDVPASSLRPGERRVCADGFEWQVREGPADGVRRWTPVGEPDWQQPKPQDVGARFAVQLGSSGAALVTIDASRMRPCWLWDSARGTFSAASSRRDALTHQRQHELDERRLLDKLSVGRSEKAADSRAPAAPLGREYEPGMRVEAALVGEGLEGSWFESTVVEVAAGDAEHALVEFDLLAADGGASEEASPREWLPVQRLRPKPPDGLGIVTTASRGDLLELKHDAGWSEVRLLEVDASARPSKQFTVQHPPTGRIYCVGCVTLRPVWQWKRGTDWVVVRDHPNLAEPLGEASAPSHRASLFQAGERRQGGDGAMWETESCKGGQLWRRVRPDGDDPSDEHERHAKRPRASTADSPGTRLGQQLVNEEIDVYISREHSWLSSKVTTFLPACARHAIRYDADGLEEVVDLNRQRWRRRRLPLSEFLPQPAAEGVGTPSNATSSFSRALVGGLTLTGLEDQCDMWQQQPACAWPALEVGQLAEVPLFSDCHSWSWYLAAVLGTREHGSVLAVRYLDFTIDEGSEPREEVPSRLARPPPPAAPMCWESSLQEGGELEVLYQGGWWSCTLVRIQTSSSGDDLQVQLVVRPKSGSRLFCGRETLVALQSARPVWLWVDARWKMAHALDTQVDETASTSVSKAAERKRQALLRDAQHAAATASASLGEEESSLFLPGVGTAAVDSNIVNAPRLGAAMDLLSAVLLLDTLDAGKRKRRRSDLPAPADSDGLTPSVKDSNGAAFSELMVKRPKLAPSAAPALARVRAGSEAPGQQSPAEPHTPMDARDGPGSGDAVEAAIEQPAVVNRAPEWLLVDSLVEAMPEDDTFSGSWFEARVLSLDVVGERVEVRLTAYSSDRPEWLPWRHVRPLPPVAPGGDLWGSVLQRGQPIELRHEGGWWEVDIVEMVRQRLSQEILYLVRSENFGDEHEVPLSMLRPRWHWHSDTRQWSMAHNGALYSATSKVGRSLTAEGPSQMQRLQILAPYNVRQGAQLRCSTEDGRTYTVTVPQNVAAGKPIRFKVERPASKLSQPEDDFFVTLPPGVSNGAQFDALLPDGRELAVVAPLGVAAGTQLQLNLPKVVEKAASPAPKLLPTAVGPSSKTGPAMASLMPAPAYVAQSAAAAPAGAEGESRKGRVAVHGITYKQLEQYIIARYGTCQNGRLMGALAAAVRNGRLLREGKLYLPSGSMLSSIAAQQLEKLSAEQRAALLAEEKRNRKLAKQALLSGKARRRQEMESARHQHNQRVRSAAAMGEARRIAFLRRQMGVLAPFVAGAKRSLQVALGVAVPAGGGENDESDEVEDVDCSEQASDREPPSVQSTPAPEQLEADKLEELQRQREESTCEQCGRVFMHAGACKSHRRVCRGAEQESNPPAEALTEESAADSTVRSVESSVELAEPAADPEVFGQLPESEVDAGTLEDLPWLEGTLQPHQVVGLNWMLSAYRNGINGILADEMGLGKTFQVIAFLSFLKYECRLKGPSLIVAPLSVLSSWVNEFKRFAPSIRVVRLHSGDQRERELMRSELLADVSSFDVVVTTYEMAASANMKSVLCQRIHWRYLVLDEGHRIKNERTMLYERLRTVKTQCKLLLTGTPLQNNLHELWALMHFLHPEIFSDSAVFDDAFDLSRGVIDEGVIAKCGQLLSAFMIRRLKREVLKTLPLKTEVLVYVPMSATQVELSRQLLLSGAQVLARMQQSTEEGREEAASNSSDWTQMQSLLLSLRKCCSHPQLFGSWMEEVSEKFGEDISTASGKLAALSALLDVLLPAGGRVVLFSGWTAMLDIIEEFLKRRDLLYARLDGSTNRVQRSIDIKAFNAKGSRLSVFLCSTRAGGLGITLTSADTVVLYDSDFNPQVDLQAMDRVHRIGQTRPVSVFRLITHGTVEERIVERARGKLYLMQRTMVGAGGEDAARAGNDEAAPASKVTRAEVISMLHFGVAGALAVQQQDGETRVTTEHIQQMLVEVRAAAADGKPHITYAIGGAKPLARMLQSSSEKGSADASHSLERLAGAQVASGDEDGVASSSVEGIEVSTAVEALGRSQRERTSRFIDVGGDLVLKINNYTLNEGEKSVFDSELHGRSKKAGDGTSTRQAAGRDYENSSICQLCWRSGDIVCCDHCPVVMHLECAGVRDESELGSTWSCPHHRCHLCGRKAHAAGGLLFRCSECPKAFCEDHLPLEAEMVGAECERFVKLGFERVKQAAYVLCSDTCKDAQQEHEEAAKQAELDAEADEDEGEDAEEEGEDEEADGSTDEQEGAGSAGDSLNDDLASSSAQVSLSAPHKVSRGMAVEYASQASGELGSFYRATVLRTSGEKATIRHAVLTTQDGVQAEEQVLLRHLRPEPPAPPRNFLASVKRGSKLEMSYLDGFWEVMVKRCLPNGRFKVEAERYEAVHEVGPELLRPAWRWNASSGRYSFA